ncbi:MAG: pilus assembly protein PilM [Planctomycetota bacterium]|nr:pilus assembly protein PilM [Planctomycetota bacterium]
MRLGMFSGQQSPIAIDFGASSVKLMQLDRSDPPQLLAAAELVIPEMIRTSPQHVMAHIEQEIPTLLKSGDFKGKKVVTAIPAALTHIQHMQVATMEGVGLEEIVKGQIEMQMECLPGSLVVRCIQVPQAKCRDSSRSEVICFAASRDVVMRYVQMLKRCKLEVSSMHTESLSTIWAFANQRQRQEDKSSPTMYINLGWQGSMVTVCHGTKLVFSRYIHLGGHHLDQQIAKILKCEIHEASTQRQSFEQPLSRSEISDEASESMSGETPVRANAAKNGDSKGTDSSTVTAIDRRQQENSDDLLPVPMCGSARSVIERYELDELADTLVDEISMCLRYHRGMFNNVPISKVVFVGGEARQSWLTRTIADYLTIEARVGDPLRQFADTELFTPGLNLNEPRPGWAVACGLCHAPTDA